MHPPIEYLLIIVQEILKRHTMCRTLLHSSDFINRF